MRDGEIILRKVWEEDAIERYKRESKRPEIDEREI